MLNVNDILETIKMIDEDCLDVRTITMGISLLDCADSDIDRSCEKVYNKITRLAKDLVKTGEDIERTYGIPIINKRISVTPIAMLVACQRRRSGQVLPRPSSGQRIPSASTLSAAIPPWCTRASLPVTCELIRSIPRATG